MANRFVVQALQTFNVQSNATLEEFFSDGNIETIQKSLRRKVRAETGHGISPQSCEQIVMVMYHVYSNHGRVVTSKKNVLQEVASLNNILLNELVPMVVSNVKQYVQYISDISKLPTPMTRSMSTSTKGSNSLELQNPF